jgi:hypothetical protein
MTYLQRFKPTDDDFEACTHVVNDQPIIGVNAKSNKARVLAITGSQGAADEHESIGNAFLFADAGTVFHQCGKSPRVLLEDYTAMLALFDVMHAIAQALPADAREHAESLVGVLEKAHPLLPRPNVKKAAAALPVHSGFTPTSVTAESAT